MSRDREGEAGHMLVQQGLPINEPLGRCPGLLIPMPLCLIKSAFHFPKGKKRKLDR